MSIRGAEFDFSFQRWCVGPDHVLEGGLASFDAVSIGRNASPKSARAPLARAILRSVQIQFLYENLPDALRRDL